MRSVYFFLAISILISICGSTRVVPSTANDGDREKALTYLSEYKFFSGNLAELIPADNVIPYQLNTPLFSDYAHKARFIYLPAGETMTYQEKEVLDMPVGTIIIKNFFYYNDERDHTAGKRLIETRLLKHTADKGWVGWPYVWDDDQQDAKYKVLGTKTHVSFINAAGETQQIAYESPNQFECKSCHSYDGDIRPIGPSARQLHKPTSSYLRDWQTGGLLVGLPMDETSWPSMDWHAEGTSVAKAARAYLDANCGYCHRHEGTASTSGLFLHDSYVTGPETGVRKSPVAAGKGSGGYKYDVLPGKPDKSILYHRMASNDPSVRMPEVGRSVAHEEGLALIKEWIATME